MKAEEFAAWEKRVNIISEGIEQAKLIYETGPTRKVQSKRGNVISISPSPLNGREIATESRTVELPYAKMLEHEPDVVGFIEQPIPLEIRYEQDGKELYYTYTPDFFVFRSASAGYVELKTEADLIKLSKAKPERYKKEDGVWRSPPTEEAAAHYGFTFELVSDAEINPIYVQNLDYLQSYYYARDSLKINPDVLEAVLRTVGNFPGISLKDLKEELEGVATADDINGMLAKKLIWVDLQANLLLTPEYVKVYSNQESAKVATRYHMPPAIEAPDLEFITKDMEILWCSEKWSITKIDENEVWLRSETGGIDHAPRHSLKKWAKEGFVKVLSMPHSQPASKAVYREYTPEQWEEAARRCEIVEKYLADGTIPPDFGKNSKTLRRWADRYLKAKEEHTAGIYGLMSQHHKKGRRKVQIPLPRLKVLVDLFKRHYLTEECPNQASALAAIFHDAIEAGVTPPSKRLFKAMRDNFSHYERELSRAGNRAAQKYKEPTPDPNRFPAEGQWFLHRVHVDHYLVPIRVQDPETGEDLGSPWLTNMVDSATGSNVGSYLSFDKPARGPFFMAVRDLVQRFGQLPEYLIADNGKEFHSYDYKCLAARYNGTLQWRPPSEAHFGAPVESRNKTIQEMLINNLRGRTFPIQESRLRTGKLKPEARAVWSLEDLKAEIDRFLYEDYDQMKLPGILMSPREARAMSMHNHGEKTHRNIAFDEEFIFLTTPVISTKHGYATVSTKGIVTGRDWYTCDAFKTPGVARTKVQVRRDPSNPDRCYASVKGEIVSLRRHISNSSFKNERSSGSHELHMARKRATERANSTVNLELRGNMMARIKSNEEALLAQKKARESLGKRTPAVMKPAMFKPVAKPSVGRS